MIIANITTTKKIERPIKIGSVYVDRGRCLPWSGNAPCIVCEEVCPISPKAIYLKKETVTGPGGKKLSEHISIALLTHQNRTKPSDVLVVYYSRSGNTEAMVKKIARRLQVDILRIETKSYGLDFKGWLQANGDSRSRKQVDISPALVYLRRYRLIFLGSPIWWYRPAPPLWTFIEKNDFGGKNVVLFNTFNSKFKARPIKEFQSSSSAIIVLHEKLPQWENVRLQLLNNQLAPVPGKVYAKVDDNHEAEVHFTSVSQEAEKVFRQRLGKK